MGQKHWIAVHDTHDGDETKVEVEIFVSEDALWKWLEPLARNYMASGDFDDYDRWTDKVELGIATRNFEKVCEGISGSMREVYPKRPDHLQIVEREAKS